MSAAPVDRHGDVLQQRGGARTGGRRRPPRRGPCGCARAPRGPPGRRLSARRRRQRQVGEDAAAARRRGSSSASGSAAWCSTSSAACAATARPRSVGVGRGSSCADAQRGGVEQLDGGRAGGDQAGSAPVAARQVVEDQQRRSRRAGAPGRCGRWPRRRSRACPRCRPRGAPGGRPARRGRGRSSRRSPSCSSSRTARAIRRTESGLPRTRSRSRSRPSWSSGSSARSRSSASGAPVSRTVPLGQHEDQRLQRPVGVELGAAGHAAGVVGDDAADGAGDSLAGSGPSLRPYAASRALTCADRRPGLHPDPRAVVEDLDAAEVLAGVDQQAVGERLAGRGWCRRSGRSAAGRLRGCARSSAATCAGVARGDHRLRDQQVVRGVVGSRAGRRRVRPRSRGPPSQCGAASAASAPEEAAARDRTGQSNCEPPSNYRHGGLTFGITINSTHAAPERTAPGLPPPLRPARAPRHPVHRFQETLRSPCI